MRFLLALLFLASTPMTALAHEFWISPHSYQVAPGAPVISDIRVGEKMKGGAFSFIDGQIERFDVTVGEESFEVTSRMGDRPALNQTIPAEGLAIIVHETTDSKVTYAEWDKFKGFTEHKDFTWALDEHRKRGLPETGFAESYRRHAKSLVAIGHGQGLDRNMGMATEILALVNPYTQDLSRGMAVRVTLFGEPRANSQIELFAKDAEGEVTITLHRTNDDGIAVFPVEPGVEYLVDSVSLVPVTPGDEPTDPVWHSLWASLTFKVPETAATN